MADPTVKYSGHTALFGMDGDLDPSYLGAGKAAKAVNRIFRGGKNKTRPPFYELKLVFENTDDETLFRTGNVQAATHYRKRRPARYDGIAVAIAGSLFFIQILGSIGFVSKFAGSLNTKAVIGWFCQCEEWLYFQNGIDLPVFWDGLLQSTARQSLGPASQEMPIGTMMVYAHGRLGLANQYNQIVFSDIIFGNGFTDTTGTQKFTENTYWQEGGFFSVPANLGNITGMVVMPMQNVNLRGQGEVVILCEQGAYSLDISIPRDQWKDAQMQRTSMIGRGNMAPYSIAEINGDIWYRASDGWATYTNSRIDFSQKVSFRKFSREVNNYLDQDTPSLIPYASHIFFNNRLIGTVSPLKEPCANELYGAHRFNRGMVSLDLDPTSGSLGGEAVNWDGLWTGIRPIQFVKGVFDQAERGFSFSFDPDGKNRLYELQRSGTDDIINERAVPIASFYVSKRYDHAEAGDTSAFEIKSITGGELWVSDITGFFKVSASYRSNNGFIWHTLMKEIANDYKPTLVNETLGYSWPRYDRFIFMTPSPLEREVGTDNLAIKGSQHQVMVKIVGSVQIDRMRIKATGNDTVVEGNTCSSRMERPPAQGEVEEDFAYILANEL